MKITSASIWSLKDRLEEAWNKGDLDVVCKLYAEDAIYVTRKGLVSGRSAILAKYKEMFERPGASMGELRLEVYDCKIRSGSEIASVIFKWTLKTTAGQSSGHSIIVCELRRGLLEIVYDASL